MGDNDDDWLPPAERRDLYVLVGQEPVLETDFEAWHDFVSAMDPSLWITEHFTPTRITQVRTYFIPFGLHLFSDPDQVSHFATATSEGPSVEHLKVEVEKRQFYRTWAEAETGHQEVVAALRRRGPGGVDKDAR